MSVFLININREKFGEFGSIYYLKKANLATKSLMQNLLFPFREIYNNPNESLYFDRYQ